jgi:hypothetical protein
MSRTDAHRPAWVQANDPLVRRREHHNHVNKDCDLEPSTKDQPIGWRFRSCYWDIDWNLVRTCSCFWCNPRTEGGPARAYWRDQLRELAKTQDREDIDIAPFIDKGW